MKFDKPIRRLAPAVDGTPPTERRIVELPRGADGLFDQPDWTKMSADERADYARDMQKRRMGAAHDADFADAVTGLANTNDPTSEYVCQGCNRRKGAKCVRVSVKELVLPESSSCNKYEIECVGDPEHDNQALSPDEAGFAIRDVKNGKFGCPNCTLQEPSGFVDELLRTLWCRRWAFTVNPVNCCSKNSAAELKIDADGMPLEQQREPEASRSRGVRSASNQVIQQPRGRRLYTADEFAKLPDQQRDGESFSIATTTLIQPEFGESGRLVTYTFSTPAVGRDLHTVAPDAWQLDNFLRNPVFLWFHDDSQPPIGRVIDIGDVNGKLKGTVEYVDRDLSPFADMIYRMVKARYINAVSTSWQPIAWKFSTDKARAGGVDFTKVDLLEISQVPVPALPAALAEARSNGIDTQPLYQWAERLLDKGDMTLIGRVELEDLRRAAKMPARATRPLAFAIDVPDDKSAGAAPRAAGNGDNDDKERDLKIKRAFTRSGADPLFKRGLYDAGRLCFLLEELGYAHFSAAFEAEMEGDGSELPAMLKDILDQLGKACIEMTEEEVNEFLDMHGPDDDDGEDDDAENRALKPAARAFIAAAKTPRTRALRRGIAISRAGKELSVTNKDQLEAAQDHHERALKHNREMHERTEAGAEHLATAQERSQRASETLAEFGEHVRAAQENPAKAKDHLDAATKAKGETEKHMAAAADAHDNAKDAHDDADDSHRALGRRIKAAQRCVRAVLSGAVTSEGDDTDADDVEKKEKSDEEMARAARAARAGELQRREPITLTLD
jgi:hypothetical protein